MIYILTMLILLVSLSHASYAQEITFHGFLQGNLSARITGEDTYAPIESGDFLSGEEKLRGEVTGSSGNSDFALKIDFVHDSISDEDRIDIREGYIDYRSTNFDIRVGRQIITWGAGDLLFINDIFPKNYSALFSGQPLEYLKIGSDAAKISAYSDIVSAELVIMRFFEPYTFPDPERFFLYSPMMVKGEDRPGKEIDNTEIALRLYRQVGRFDTSLYVYKGFYKIPGMKPLSSTEAVLIYPELSVYGFSMQGYFANGVLSLEGGYYDSMDDKDGDDPTITNSTARYIAGYSKQLWTDFTASAQIYGEYMQEYDKYEDYHPPEFPKTDRLHQLITIRFNQMLKYNTLRLSLFSFYSPDDEDYFIIPEVRYNITDSMWTTVGLNIFGGEDSTTFFGQLGKNDNFYATIRFEF
ncbi:MAG TPA: hypothetical protein DCR39_06615 [Nitrospiraceae bacterium]|nr:hypothetical protein [Nitrospiraceae bacterium]